MFTDKRNELYILCRKNKTSPEYHRLCKNLEALENQYWG